MSRFNLVDENWIPVRFLDGTRKELGIRAVLLQAKKTASIEDASPLVVAALHRFLLAVLDRALEGPTDIDQAKLLFKSGFPKEKIETYLEKWHDRFWLFDEKYPFGQNPNVPSDRQEPWTKLTAEYNATTRRVLFDHTDTHAAGERTPAECARWLIATLNFSIAGGAGLYPSPSSNAMMCIPQGDNLQKTLCFCLVYENREIIQTDKPIWERKPKPIPLNKAKRSTAGYADLFTWQSRMILLEQSESGLVGSMRFIAGEGVETPSVNPDPMQPYRSDQKRGRMPVQFRSDRGTWRDFDSLLPDEEGLAPLTMQNAFALAGTRTNDLPKAVLVLGLRYTPPNANLDFWRMERFALPQILAENRFIRRAIHTLLVEAEKSQHALWSACRSYARHLLSRGDRDPDKKDIRAFLDQMLPIPMYWGILESRFHEILEKYVAATSSVQLRAQWLESIRGALRTSWEYHRASVSTADAWAIRAVVMAEWPVQRRLNELDQEIEELRLDEEVT
jgi:CRISPR system Cascade subunit CasA